jgi:hypothetical protein
MNRIQYLTAHIALTAMLTLSPAYFGDIKHIVENAVISMNLIELATKLLDKKDQS